LGLVPQEGEPLAMTPVDYVAAALVVLSSQPSSLGKTFHLTNSASITLAELAAWLAARGYPIATVSPADFRDAVLRAAEASPDQPLYPLLTALDEADLTEPSADVASPSPAYAAHRNTSQRFDTRNTQAGLAGTAISCPPVDDTLLTTYFGSLTTSGFLPNMTVQTSRPGAGSQGQKG
jgi:thioester reductase-like protein